MLLCILISSAADNSLRARRAIATNHIVTQYPEQLTDPQKKTRKCFCQFGYGLYLVNIPLFPITAFVDDDKLGVHSYGKPGKKESNGSIYTCRGGFIDLSHVRSAADWTVYLAFKMITAKSDFNLPDEGGQLQLTFNNLEAMSMEDITNMAQKIAFERHVWHEVVSWYHHAPNHTLNEQQSTFTPEDTYSNFLGALAGKNIATRILNLETTPYEQIASEEIEKLIRSLNPVETKRQSKQAYNVVDLNKQVKLNPSERNYDVWWTSKVEFSDQRYVFKRDMDIGPQISPWLIPQPQKAGCEVNPKPVVMWVPQKTRSGESFYDHYQFKITPSDELFYNKRNGKQIHEPFKPFATQNFNRVIQHLTGDMEKALLAGFNQRDSNDPTPNYKHLRKVVFK